MGITASRLQELGLIDEIIGEPLGGAHRAYDDAANRLRDALIQAVSAFDGGDTDELIEQRYKRLTSYGRYRETG